MLSATEDQSKTTSRLLVLMLTNHQSGPSLVSRLFVDSLALKLDGKNRKHNVEKSEFPVVVPVDIINKYYSAEISMWIDVVDHLLLEDDVEQYLRQISLSVGAIILVIDPSYKEPDLKVLERWISKMNNVFIKDDESTITSIVIGSQCDDHFEEEDAQNERQLCCRHGFFEYYSLPCELSHSDSFEVNDDLLVENVNDVIETLKSTMWKGMKRHSIENKNESTLVSDDKYIPPIDSEEEEYDEDDDIFNNFTPDMLNEINQIKTQYFGTTKRSTNKDLDEFIDMDESEVQELDQFENILNNDLLDFSRLKEIREHTLNNSSNIEEHRLMAEKIAYAFGLAMSEYDEI